MSNKHLLITFLLGAAFLCTYQVLAIGLSVWPSELTISGDLGKEIVSSFKVKNLSTDVALFEVYPDELTPMIKLNPTSFTLQGEEEREVKMIIKLAGRGRFETTLSATARPLSSSAFQAGAGVKIPLHISIGEENTKGLAAIGFLVKNNLNYIAAGILLLLLSISWKIIRRRS